jgi:hypothetical protein|nr:MAG TPA: YonK protein [Caudoviricetes sp.]
MLKYFNFEIKYKGNKIMVAKKSVVFKNAIIDTEADTITEITKDGENVFSLKESLAKWDGIEGVTINISTSDELLGDPA